MSKLKITGIVLGGLILLVAIPYFIWGAAIPMRIFEKKVEREVIQQSPQYVISQRSAMRKFYKEYLSIEDGSSLKEAVRDQICEIANNIPKDEWIKPVKEENLCEY